MKFTFALLACALFASVACTSDTLTVEAKQSPPVQSETPQTKTSKDYLAEGSRYYIEGDYKGAIPPYRRALDMEKKERKLEKKLWIVLVDNLGMAYGITGDIKSSHAVFEYGIKEEPTYPLFYYNMACGFGELGDEDNAIKYLRPAFKHKANMISGEGFPDPLADSSFARFRDSDKFRKAVAEMKGAK